jgi:hypothetical protein
MRKFESAQEETPHFDGIQQNMWKKLIMGNLWEVYVCFSKKPSPENWVILAKECFEFTLFMDGVLPSALIYNFLSSMFELHTLCI